MSYYNKKLLQAILFTKNPRKYLTDQVLTDEFFELLIDKVNQLKDVSILNDQMKFNLLELINYIRFNSKMLKKDLYEKINNLIINVNKSEISFYQWQTYLFEEFEKRSFDDKSELNFVDDYQLNDLFESMELDYTSLQAFLCSKEDFEDYFAPELILNEFYLSSIKVMMLEIPELLECENNCLRVIEILSVNEAFKKNKKEILNYNAKQFNRIIKDGKILCKKMMKQT